MVLQYYVVETATGKQIEIDIESATNEDLTSTKEKWQSDWTSEFIRDPKLEKYAAKTDAGEIVALGAYREDDHGISVFIANIEAHPESNPTISTVRKYAGIGRMMIAYGIQLSIDSGHGGIVTFEAKTDELYDHYIKDFHAVPIFSHIWAAQSCLCWLMKALKKFSVPTYLKDWRVQYERSRT